MCKSEYLVHVAISVIERKRCIRVTLKRRYIRSAARPWTDVALWSAGCSEAGTCDSSIQFNSSARRPRWLSGCTKGLIKFLKLIEKNTKAKHRRGRRQWRHLMDNVVVETIEALMELNLYIRSVLLQRFVNCALVAVSSWQWPSRASFIAELTCLLSNEEW